MIKRDIIDWITDDNFFNTVMDRLGFLNSWGKVIEKITNYCYEDRNSLVNELFNKIPTRFVR